MSHPPEERLGPYLEGELGPDERRDLELHLEACEPCARSLAELRATVGLLRLVPDPEAPPRLGQQVMERIQAAEHRPLARLSAWLGGSGSPLASVIGALSAAAMVLLTVEVVGPSRPPWRAGSPTPVATSGKSGASEALPGLREVPPRPRPLPLASARPAATGTRSLASAFRLRPEGSGSVGVGGAAPGVSLLPPRPALARCQEFGRAVGDGEAGYECRPWLSGMLTLAQFNPHGFLGQVSVLPAEERDAWLDELVGFAARSGALSRAVAGLRSSIDPGAALLADRFERGSRTAHHR